MCNEDGTIWIVFNGEIYNFQELRTELIARGHRFKSRSDTEVIIHLYEEHGVKCLDKLRGMFAFAIWDSPKQQLLLARDRLGIKPLYFAQTAGSLWFASEIKAILADPAVPRMVEPLAFRLFLSFSYTPTDVTPFKNILKLPAGHYLVVKHGRVTRTQYWDLNFNRERSGLPYAEAVDSLYEILNNTVRDHMVADVPVGVLLSGGLDSSAITSFAVRNTSKKLYSFTLGFDDDSVVDERPYARSVAQRFGTEHIDLTITAHDFWHAIPQYTLHMEELVCEPPAISLYYITRKATDFVKVILSGEGGDEAFAGYNTYPTNLRLDRISRSLGAFARIAGRLSSSVAGTLGIDRFATHASTLGHNLSDHYFSRASNPSSYFIRNARTIFSSDFLAETQSPSPRQIIEQVRSGRSSWPLLDQMLYIDTKTWLADDLLIKADKMTMANSMELRVPLLDHQVLEFAASLPSEYKLFRRTSKRVLRDAFSKVLPNSIIHRKKAGFPSPFSRWLRYELHQQACDLLLSSKAASRGILNMDGVRRMLAIHAEKGCLGKELFSLIALESWYKEFVDQKNARTADLS